LKRNISNNLTGYLLKTMSFGVGCLFFIAISYSYFIFLKSIDENKLSLESFGRSILPATTRDLMVGNIEALKIRTEFIVIKEQSQHLQIKVEGDNGEILYESDGYGNDCTSNYFGFKKLIKICHNFPIEYSNKNLGTIFLSKEINSFYSLFSELNMPILFGILVFFLFSILLLVRKFMKEEVIVPIKNLVLNLEENFDFDRIKVKSMEWTILSGAIGEYKKKILNYASQQSETAKDLQKEKMMSEITAQLAHDIRSPLSALDMIAAHIPELDEEKRILIRNATARIHNIANNLLDRNFNRSNNVSTHMFSSLIRSVIFEKREQYKSKTQISIYENVTEKSYGTFAKIDINDFKRILSNLIDNSVQAIFQSGFVTIGLSQTKENVVIEVSDNGKGIAREFVDKVTVKGFSQKENGSGLGLYFVSQKIAELQGELKIVSTVDVGTSISIILRKEPPPLWFVSEIKIYEDKEYIILDDDESIHKMWQSKFIGVAKHQIKMKHFEDEQSFREWFRNSDKANRRLYLFDYELIGNKNTGLDILEKLEITEDAILVTSHYENEEIQKRCERIGVRMIPKDMAGFVPIIVN